MKKLLLLTMSMMLAATSVFGLSACAKEDPEKTLYIEIENAGFGVKWIEPLIDIFEEEHPGIKVKPSSIVKGAVTMIDKVKSGSTTQDLLFVENSYAHNNADQKVTSNGVIYDSPYAEISDIFLEKIPGESLSIAEKMLPAFLDFNTFTQSDGSKKYYTMPWMQGPVGIVVNNNLWKGEYGKFPNTTDDFAEFCNMLKNKGVTPFIYSLETSYWDDIYSVWMAQYDGQAGIKSFYDGYASYYHVDESGNIVEGVAQNGEETPRYVPEMMLDQGLRKALGVLENILSPEKGFSDSDDITLDFTLVQNKFLEGGDNILMMPNGGWLEREMEVNYDPDELNISMAKIPVVSALGDKLGINGADGDDSILSAIIDYVDGTTEVLPEFESSKGYADEEVVAVVREARSMVPANHGFAAVIPVYSTKIDLAKEFLQLVASDRGIEAMLKECGSMAPFKYNLESVKGDLSPFMSSVNNMVQEGTYFFTKECSLFKKGNLKLINQFSEKVSIKFGASDQKDRQSANKVYSENYKYVADRWDTYKRDAGIA